MIFFCQPMLTNSTKIGSDYLSAMALWLLRLITTFLPTQTCHANNHRRPSYGAAINRELPPHLQQQPQQQQQQQQQFHPDHSNDGDSSTLRLRPHAAASAHSCCNGPGISRAHAALKLNIKARPSINPPLKQDKNLTLFSTKLFLCRNHLTYPRGRNKA